MGDFDEALLYSLVKNSTHPISRAIAQYYNDEKLDILDLKDIKTIEAKGIKAKYKNRLLYGGNQNLLKENGITCRDYFEHYSQFYFAIDGEVVAVFALVDTPRIDAKKYIKEIKKLGVDVAMLTGDNDKVAKKIANEVGIDKTYSSLLPIDKANIVEKQEAPARR